jgi:hypothetical protein
MRSFYHTLSTERQGLYREVYIYMLDHHLLQSYEAMAEQASMGRGLNEFCRAGSFVTLDEDRVGLPILERVGRAAFYN